jgi:gliding motility-associated-like protein
VYKFIFKILGWKINEDVPKEYTRCVLVGAPHTSNWDFFYAIFLFKILKIPYKFTIKSEWFKFPFNLIIKPLGGIPINTKSKTKGGNVNIMADLFKDNKEFAMGITPEATRSLRTKWKSGFYHLAKDNNLPICLGYLDYKTRTSPNGDGLNDELFIYGIDNSYELKIFNRWGTCVYKEFPYLNGWKGYRRSEKKLPEGQYYFTLRSIARNIKLNGGIMVVY